ncbi:family 5 glycoside hydrolase [Phakopsora pachyrhizi]|nr:family 5 glycoside hydrolase [Phakopsora pachyrhizi]
MSFLKKATEKLREVQSISNDRLNHVRSKLPSSSSDASSHNQVATHNTSNNNGLLIYSEAGCDYSPTGVVRGSAANQGRFIVRNPSNGELEVEGTGEIVRFASLCAPDLFDDDGFEKEDTMRTISEFGIWPVTRTYTLKIKSCRIGRGHINGWDQQAQDFIYDEEMFRSIEYTIAMAARCNCYNVRLIIPIINQDFGSEDNNWVGNFSDLIRHRRGLKDWNDCRCVDWWRDEECMDSIKSLAPRTLVMDGSFARTDSIDYSHEKEVLQSDLVDIMSWHYYGYGEKRRLEHDVRAARSHGKAFICGEYGFFSHGHEFEKFLSHCASHKANGTLAWSLRPHSSQGGFKTHGEGDGIWSYHAPGWKPAHLGEEDPEWDHRERDVIQAIRVAAFKLTGDKPTRIKIVAPELFVSDDGQYFSWRGASWADCYEVWINVTGDQNGWEFYQGGVTDNVKGGRLKYYVQNLLNFKRCDGLGVIVRGITRDREPGPFS